MGWFGGSKPLADQKGIWAGKKKDGTLTPERQAYEDAARARLGDGETAADAAPPPSTARLGSDASAAAQQAAMRQRRRAAAGNTLLSGAATRGGAPTAKLSPRTLLGTS
jgi:hypothetical protein